jgi:hypothetical protein
MGFSLPLGHVKTAIRNPTCAMLMGMNKHKYFDTRLDGVIAHNAWAIVFILLLIITIANIIGLCITIGSVTRSL